MQRRMLVLICEFWFSVHFIDPIAWKVSFGWLRNFHFFLQKKSWFGWSKNVWLVLVTTSVNESYFPSLRLPNLTVKYHITPPFIFCCLSYFLLLILRLLHQFKAIDGNIRIWHCSASTIVSQAATYRYHFFPMLNKYTCIYMIV